MRAALLNTYANGAPLQSGEAKKPVAKPGQVLVRIAASSVNTVDTKIRMMGQPGGLAPQTPAILGMDFAGTVEAVGDEVAGFAVGDEVYGCAGGLCDLPGTLAEYIAADHRLVAHKPGVLSMREAAALPLVAITAYEGLTRARVGAGQRVLVHGGSGGVGHAALQLANYFGADVYSTGGGERQLALIERLGATAINYKTEAVQDYVAKHTNAAGFDVVYDTVGDRNMLNSFEAVKLNGDVITTTTMCELNLTAAHLKGLTLHIVFMLIPMIHDAGRETHGQILTEIARIVDAGGLVPVVDEARFSLDRAADAHAYLKSGKAMGKVVIEVSDDNSR
ncbi:MAG: zinc-dependent alcohol dehydrogenase family protein [Planctomycetota bacterium]